MKKIDQKEIIFNKAEVKQANQISCENCFEKIVFLLKDKDHEFSMGLQTVLECLAFAIENGDLPKLPLSWVSMVYDGNVNTNIAYYDEKHYRKRDTDEILQGKSDENSK